MNTRRESGRKGGLVTLERYGKAQLRAWGRLGGRPRNPDYDDIRQRQTLEKQNNGKEVNSEGPPATITQLRRLYKLQAAESSGEPNTRGGGCPENPTRTAPARKDA